MEYPAKFTSDKAAGGFVVTFPDVPEAITQGDTMEEAMAMASEALELAFTFYTEKWADLPEPSQPRRGMRMVRVPALSEAKFRLYSARAAYEVLPESGGPAAGYLAPFQARPD